MVAEAGVVTMPAVNKTATIEAPGLMTFAAALFQDSAWINETAPAKFQI